MNQLGQNGAGYFQRIVTLVVQVDFTLPDLQRVEGGFVEGDGGQNGGRYTRQGAYLLHDAPAI